MMGNNNITGIILAGGKSSRMGSDKGFLSLNGSSFMSHIIKAVQPWVTNVLIVSNNSDYDVFNLKRVEDILEDSGPLAGLYSGLLHSETEHNLIVSCDVPLLNGVILKKLIEAFDTETDIVQLQSQGRTMPLVAMYKKQCMHQCLELLERGERRLRVLAEGLNTKTIILDSELDKYVKNINTIDQYTALTHEVED